MVNLRSQFGGQEDIEKLTIPTEVAIKSPRDFGVRFFNALSRTKIIDHHNRSVYNSSGLSQYKDMQ